MGWKAAERESARRLGGQRVPITGRVRGSAPDHTTAGDLWSVEMKMRKAFPKWLLEALEQAIASQEQGAGRWPLVILHPKGRRYEDDLMILRRKDFEEIHTLLLSCFQDDTQDGTIG